MQMLNGPLLIIFSVTVCVGMLLIASAMFNKQKAGETLSMQHRWIEKSYLLLVSLLLSSITFQVLDIFVEKNSFLRIILLGDTGTYVWPYTIQAIMWFMYILFFVIFVYRVFLDETVSLHPISFDAKRAFFDSKLESLNLLAWIIPTLGFIGTVVGLMESLDVIASSKNLIEDMQNGLMNQVLNGLAVAFSTTIFGLILSMLCMLSYSYLSKDYYKRCSVDG